MKPILLRKLSAYALIAGGLLFAAYAVCFTFFLPVQEMNTDFAKMVNHPNWIWIASLALAGALMMVFGFTAVYGRISERTGWLGFMGYLFITVAYILQAAQLVMEIFLYPIIAGDVASAALLRDNVILNHPLNLAFSYGLQAVILIGVVLFGITLIRCKEFHKLGGILFLSGALFYATVSVVSIYIGVAGIIMFAAGCAITGHNLLFEKQLNNPG